MSESNTVRYKPGRDRKPEDRTDWALLSTMTDEEVEAAADVAGVTVRGISRLYRRLEPRQGLMLGFTGFPARMMAGGVARLAAALG